MSSASNNSLVVGVQSIEVTPGDQTNQISLTADSSGFLATIDSSLPYLWLPDAICDKFVENFRLTFDNSTNLFTVNDTARNLNRNDNSTVTFKIGSTASPSNSFTSVVLPYAAFDLTANPPLAENSTNYFPIKRSPTNIFVLGRAFLQEAYVVVDYERGNFTVAPANFSDPMPDSHILPIYLQDELPPATPSPSGKGSSGGGGGTSGISRGAIAGIAIGVVVIVLLAILGGFCFWRRRGKQKQKEKDLHDGPPPAFDTIFAGNEVNNKPRRISELDANNTTSPSGRASVTGYYGERENKDPSQFPPINETPQEMETPTPVAELESPPTETRSSPRSMSSQITEYFDDRLRSASGRRHRRSSSDARSYSQGRRAPVSPMLSNVHELAGDDGRFQVHGQHFEPVGTGGHSRGPSGATVDSGTLTAVSDAVSDPTTEQLEAWALGQDEPREPLSAESTMLPAEAVALSQMSPISEVHTSSPASAAGERRSEEGVREGRS